MYDKLFWTKYGFRLAHIFSVIFLGGKIIIEYLYPCLSQGDLTKGQKITYALLGIILIVSGYVNKYLLKGKENLKENNKLWTGLLHLKLLTSILVLTPLFTYITNKISYDFPKSAVQFYFVIIWIAVSPFLRYYREMWTAFHKDTNLTRGYQKDLQQVKNL